MGSFFNNAIIKAFSNNAATLQEYIAGDTDKTKIRADLLVYWKVDHKKPVYLLFEAKQYKEDDKNKILADSIDYLDFVKEQAQKYYDAEKLYYSKKTFFLIPLIFGWLRGPELLNEAKKYFDANHTKEDSTDFCYLFYEGDNGAWVYGKVYEVKSK